MQNNILEIFMIYLFVINMVTLFVSWADKKLAQIQGIRVPETTLITLAIIGGSLGLLCSMYLFHHKTKKPKFSVGVPVIIILQLALIFIFLNLTNKF